METVLVKPAPGARVRQPNRNNRVMPQEGDRVPRDVYYERLIMGGDLIVSGEQAEATPASSEAPTVEPAEPARSKPHRPQKPSSEQES